MLLKRRPIGLRSNCKWQIRSEKPQNRRVIFKIKTYPVLQCTTEQKNWNKCLWLLSLNSGLLGIQVNCEPHHMRQQWLVVILRSMRFQTDVTDVATPEYNSLNINGL